MSLTQLSLFVENRPGQLRIPCEVIGRAGLDLLTVSLADTAQFGILRVIVKDWQRAKAALEEAGFVVTPTDVLVVEVPDHPGGLAGVLQRFEEEGISVEYMYELGTPARGASAMLVFRVEDAGAAAARLRARGVRLLERDEIFAKMGA
jgi:hypothetical protein